MRRLAAFPLLLATAFAATGWLYVFRPALPGPRLGEALPLDELAKHSSAPLLWFAAVWLVAAAALGLFARSAGFERLTAALLLGVGTGLFGYLQTGLSIAVVRQIPLRDALDSASRLQSVYLPAALVALAVAALAPARSRGGGRRCSSRRSSLSAPSSTSCTRSCRETTPASCTRSPLMLSARLRAPRVRSRVSRCSSRLAGLHDDDGGRGRSRWSSPAHRPHCTC